MFLSLALSLVLFRVMAPGQELISFHESPLHTFPSYLYFSPLFCSAGEEIALRKNQTAARSIK